jgi:ribonuclease BN (tRNA processing enzyme)
MRIVLLPSCLGSSLAYQYLSTFRINDTVAVDAGSLGFVGSPEEQAQVRHVLLTHSHSDHTASLPVFVENAFQAGRPGVAVYGSAATLDSLRRDVFNDRVFPDFLRLSAEGPTAFLTLHELRPGEPVVLDGLTATPVEVDHVVPTLAFVLREPGAAVLLATDTAPTEALWRVAAATPELRAVFLEVTFPDDLAWLAEVSKHHTTATFAAELVKLARGVPVFAIHLKACYRETILAELAAHGLADVQVAEPGRVYRFD